jgi:hypothetical protein
VEYWSISIGGKKYEKAEENKEDIGKEKGEKTEETGKIDIKRIK